MNEWSCPFTWRGRGAIDPDQYAAFAGGLDSNHHFPRLTPTMTTSMSSRRRFLVVAALATAALPLGLQLMGKARAAGLPRLPVDNPQAKALGYSEDAATVKLPNCKPGSNCSNCQFFTASTGACALFAGFSVSPKGWCSAWSKKPA